MRELATYQVAIELLGHDERSTWATEVELRGRSAWDAVAGLREHLRAASWCSAIAFRVGAVTGPGAAELPRIVGWAFL